MRKLFSKLAAVVMTLACVAGFSACNMELDEAPYQPIEIEIDKNISAELVAIVNVDGSEKSLMETLAAEFKKDYPNVTIDVVQNADPISYIRSGDKVDIVHVIGENVSYYASQDILTPLDEYMEAANFDKDAYYASMLKLGRDSVSDKTYMMPRDYSRIMCFYNKTIFDSCGVAYPTDTEENPWTWERFLDTCKALKESPNFPSNYVPVQAAMSYDILNWAIVSSYGVEGILNDDYTLVGSDSDTFTAWRNGMNTAADMITRGYSLDSNKYSSDDFQRGSAAMSLNVGSATVSYRLGQLDYDVVPFPSIGDDPKIPTGTSGYTIAKNSYNKNVAWAFLNFIMSERGQEIVSEECQLVPVLKSLAEDEQAAWRNMKNGKNKAVDSSQFIKYTERDVTATWFGKLPALASNAYSGFYKTFLNDVCNGSKSFAQAHTVLGNKITEFKRNYPEYFA